MSICEDQPPISPKELLSPDFLQSLPPELVEPIIADIDSTADLLSLALTCKALYGIIVPFHLHFRKINLNIGVTPLALWYGIIAKPRLSSMFRTFHSHGDPHKEQVFYPSSLVQEGETYLPSTETSPGIADVFLRAISQLTGLVKFNYTTPHGAKWINTSQILWTLSISSPLLAEVYLHPEGVEMPSSELISPPEIYPTLVIFPSLQSLIVDFAYTGDSDMLLCFEILAVGRFPKLQVLHLLEIYNTPNRPPAITVFINSATLPQLLEFMLVTRSNVYSQDMTKQAKADVVYRFLARHPLLESLSVLSSNGEFWQPLFLERDHCPNVSVLSVDGMQRRDDLLATDVITASLAGQLQKLSARIGPRSLSLLGCMNMLKECILHIPYSLPMTFLHSLPISIKRLVVIIHPELILEPPPKGSPFDCIPHLTRLHNLTHVGGFNWDMTFIAGEKKAFLEKLSVLTKLEYIGGWGQHSPFRWIPLQKLKDEFAMENELKLRDVFPWAIPGI
ncbi:hypothetical protein M422DRAFT_32140 [Sphaerobolus stellatus SS14]|uniref:F-box domain-containing protein n=1 Tax=Sphaerobolus stellatus (strain SS14) TaxID=990650 RepID=A0A0C9UC61_SPHS4|nr:hypothetical protein M422DRAFT_32140 [Sphaerobolus stellatus SS14]